MNIMGLMFSTPVAPEATIEPAAESNAEKTELYSPIVIRDEPPTSTPSPAATPAPPTPPTPPAPPTTYRQAIDMVIKDGLALQYIDRKMQSIWICKAAVKQNPEAIKYIIDENMRKSFEAKITCP